MRSSFHQLLPIIWTKFIHQIQHNCNLEFIGIDPGTNKRHRIIFVQQARFYQIWLPSATAYHPWWRVLPSFFLSCWVKILDSALSPHIEAGGGTERSHLLHLQRYREGGGLIQRHPASSFPVKTLLQNKVFKDKACSSVVWAACMAWYVSRCHTWCFVYPFRICQ